MPFVTSKDGTKIAYETRGKGPALLLIDGAMCSRQMGPMPALADALADRFTVWIFDRRGRGESGDTGPYSTEREVEDIAALVEKSGGNPFVFGISSGAILAAKAVKAAPGVKKLALFEGPMIVDNTHPPPPADFLPQTRALVAAGRLGDAVKKFMRLVGVPGFVLVIMPLMPVWKKITINAATLPNDLTLVEPLQQGKALDPAEWAHVRMPTLVIDGGKSPVYMRNAQRQWSKVLPDAAYKTLPGETHNVKTASIALVLMEFFA
jgi:pimeloyl-ACP methyl ester carboxylesterase